MISGLTRLTLNLLSHNTMHKGNKRRCYTNAMKSLHYAGFASLHKINSAGIMASQCLILDSMLAARGMTGVMCYTTELSSSVTVDIRVRQCFVNNKISIT